MSKKGPFSEYTLFSYLVFSRKNVHFLNNTVLSFHFYQIFHEKPTAVMPILDQKSVHSIKTTLYYGQKVNSTPFFPFFTNKSLLSCPHFVKNVHFLKTSALKSIFCQKTSIILKHCALISFLSNFSWKSSFCLAPILTNLHYIMDPKVYRVSFFFSFFT